MDKATFYDKNSTLGYFFAVIRRDFSKGPGNTGYQHYHFSETQPSLYRAMKLLDIGVVFVYLSLLFCNFALIYFIAYLKKHGWQKNQQMHSITCF